MGSLIPLFLMTCRYHRDRLERGTEEKPEGWPLLLWPCLAWSATIAVSRLYMGVSGWVFKCDPCECVLPLFCAVLYCAALCFSVLFVSNASVEVSICKNNDNAFCSALCRGCCGHAYQ